MPELSGPDAFLQWLKTADGERSTGDGAEDTHDQNNTFEKLNEEGVRRSSFSSNSESFLRTSMEVSRGDILARIPAECIVSLHPSVTALISSAGDDTATQAVIDVIEKAV